MIFWEHPFVRLQGFIDRLETHSLTLGVLVRRAPLSSRVLGNTDASCIRVRAGLNKEQQLLTLIHELTHILVHCRAQPGIDQTVCEYEAHAVEQLVGAQLGLATCRTLAKDLSSITDDLLACSVKRVKLAAETLLAAARGCHADAKKAV